MIFNFTQTLTINKHHSFIFNRYFSIINKLNQDINNNLEDNQNLIQDLETEEKKILNLFNTQTHYHEGATFYFPKHSFLTVFSKPFTPKHSENKYHISAQTVLIKENMAYHYSTLDKFFQDLNPQRVVREITDYSIYIVWLNLEENKERSIELNNFHIHIISLNTFADMLNDPENLKLHNNRFFLFSRFHCWADIAIVAANKGITISGGEASKRHLLSPIAYKLSLLLSYRFGGDLETLSKYISYEDMPRKLYAPHVSSGSIEKNRQRINSHPYSMFRKQFSTSTRSHNFNSLTVSSRVYTLNNRRLYSQLLDNTENKELSNNEIVKIPENINTFLKAIKNIIEENSIDPIKAQTFIEKEWIQIGLETIDDKNLLMKNTNSIVKEATEILEIFKHRGSLKRSFGEFSDLLFNNRNILITLALLIGFTNKGGETNIASMVGRNIIYNTYEEYKKNIDKDIDLKTFLIKYNLDNKEKVIKLGLIFLDIFTSQIGIEVFERVNFDNEGFKIKINPNFLENLQNNLIITPQSLPMIAPPRKWSKDNLGGFLLNTTDNENCKGLVTGSGDMGMVSAYPFLDL
jgi:hypothetical protein